MSGVEGPYDEDYRSFLLFWPLTYRWGTPDSRREQLVAERYTRGDRIESLMGNARRIKTAILQVDCFIDWHSVLAQQPPQGEPETRKFFETTYPGIYNWYHQNFTIESLTNIVPLVNQIWGSAVSPNDDLFLDPALGKIFGSYDSERRKQVLAKFLAYAERAHGESMWAQQRLPFSVHWEPAELDALVKARKTST